MPAIDPPRSPSHAATHVKTNLKTLSAPRYTVAQLISGWLDAGRFPDREIATLTSGRAFITEVVYGVLRHYRTLLFFRERLASRRPAAPIDAVLLAALYELLYLDASQAFAVVHEAVEVARALGGRPAASFVNAILRRAQREETQLRAALQKAPPGIRHSHPEILLNRWKREYGDAKTTALCLWNNDRPETVIHIMTQRTTIAAMIADATARTIELKPHPARPHDSLIVPRGVAVERIPGFEEGFFMVQDPSTLGAVDLLAPQPGETIIDTCASPGGKAVAIWDRLEGRGKLVAFDTHDDRIKRLRENFGRMKINDAYTGITDAAHRSRIEVAIASARAESPDAILLDVPCSNTGVLRRRADARWRFTEDRLAELTELQARMLITAAAVLGPRGRVIYSTCSLEAEENEQQVQRFLAAHPAFKLAGEKRSFPPESGMDGAYAARLEKNP